MDQCQARSVRVEGRQTVTDRLHDSTGIRGHVSGEPNLGPLGDSCSGETRLLSARLAGLWRLGTLLGVEPGVTLCDSDTLRDILLAWKMGVR